MTVTIDIPARAVELLKAKADRLKTDTSSAAAKTLLDALEWEEFDREQAVEGIQRGLDAFEAGRHRPGSDFVHEQRSKYLAGK